MSFIENYRKIITKKKELDTLQEELTNEVKEFFVENNYQVTTIQLYANSLVIRTNYTMFELGFLNKLYDKYKNFGIRVEISNGLLAIIINLQ